MLKINFIKLLDLKILISSGNISEENLPSNCKLTHNLSLVLIKDSIKTFNSLRINPFS